jgi:hypothetical protein
MYVNTKMIPVETSRNWWQRIKERSGGGEFKYNRFDTL